MSLAYCLPPSCDCEEPSSSSHQLILELSSVLGRKQQPTHTERLKRVSPNLALASLSICIFLPVLALSAPASCMSSSSLSSCPPVLSYHTRPILQVQRRCGRLWEAQTAAVLTPCADLHHPVPSTNFLVSCPQHTPCSLRMRMVKSVRPLG